MLYYVIRIFFVVLVAIICGIIIYVVSKNFKIEKKSITFRVMSIVCGCLLIFTYCFPYEGVVIKFNNVDKVFNYYFPKCKIIKKYETDDYAYILFLDKDNAERFIYYVNSKNGWKYDSDFRRGQGDFKSLYPYTIIVNKIK